MAIYHRHRGRKRISYDYHGRLGEVVGTPLMLVSAVSSASLLDQETRKKRELANSNERRRMKTINSGFKTLLDLLPSHLKRDKLSKALILQCTADYVYELAQENRRLLEYNSQLSKSMLDSPRVNHDSDESCSRSPLPRIEKQKPADDNVKQELIEVRSKLERERRLRLYLEKQIRNLELQNSNNQPDSVEQIYKKFHRGIEHNIKSPVNADHKREIRNPRSQISCQNVRSSHEISLQDPIPEDLSRKNSYTLPQYGGELSLSDVTTLQGLSSSQINGPSPVKTNIPPQQAPYTICTSKQSLQTIVEAIKLVEGDHMFRDDTIKSEETKSTVEENLSVIIQDFAD